MKQLFPSVFKYLCYRKFLSDYYYWHKTYTYGFSYRLMAKNLGFSSPNFLKLVIVGERNISRESLEKIIQGIGLNKLETEYFSYLVFFAQAKNNIDKNYYFGLLASLRSNSNITKVAPEQYELFGQWYNTAIRELVAGMSHPLDYNVLSNSLVYSVSPLKIKKSVALLIRLGLLSLNSDNIYELTSPILNTDNELNTFAIRHYHKEVLNIAQMALDEISPEQRENSHVTIKISHDGFLKIKKRIQEFREEILQITADDHNVNEIYHVNLQIYPITKNRKND